MGVPGGSWGVPRGPYGFLRVPGGSWGGSYSFFTRFYIGKHTQNIPKPTQFQRKFRPNLTRICSKFDPIFRIAPNGSKCFQSHGKSRGGPAAAESAATETATIGTAAVEAAALETATLEFEAIGLIRPGWTRTAPPTWGFLGVPGGSWGFLWGS